MSDPTPTRIRWTQIHDADKWNASDDVFVTAETPEIALEIERRWNSHDQLVDALEMIRRQDSLGIIHATAEAALKNLEAKAKEE